MARPDQLSRIKDLVEEGKLDQAREEALGFIQYDLPKGREIHLVQTAAGGQKIPAIQLPLKVGHVQLPLLYVAKGPHGLHLYGGEEFSEGQFLTDIFPVSVHVVKYINYWSQQRSNSKICI